MSFERSYGIESHERIKLILIFGDKSLLLTWWVICIMITCYQPSYSCAEPSRGKRSKGRPRVHWIGNINRVLISLGMRPRGTIDKGLKKMEVISLYPLPLKGKCSSQFLIVRSIAYM